MAEELFPVPVRSLSNSPFLTLNVFLLFMKASAILNAEVTQNKQLRDTVSPTVKANQRELTVCHTLLYLVQVSPHHVPSWLCVLDPMQHVAVKQLTHSLAMFQGCNLIPFGTHMAVRDALLSLNIFSQAVEWLELTTTMKKKTNKQTRSMKVKTKTHAKLAMKNKKEDSSAVTVG